MTPTDRRIMQEAGRIRGWPYMWGYSLVAWFLVADLSPHKFRSPIFTIITSKLRTIRPYNFSGHPFFSAVAVFLGFSLGSAKATAKRVNYLVHEFAKANTPFGDKMREE